jgi:hypothetical protein
LRRRRADAACEHRPAYRQAQAIAQTTAHANLSSSDGA